jgi:hypothetical protein
VLPLGWAVPVVAGPMVAVFEPATFGGGELVLFRAKNPTIPRISRIPPRPPAAKR